MLYAVPTAWYPFGSDQGIHWYLGHALLHGEMPYASGISGKPPLIFVVHAIAETLFGNRQSSIRILEIACLPLFGWLIARGVRRPSLPTRDGEQGAAAMLLSAANFTYQDYWNTAHPEFYMTLALFGALVIALHAKRPRRRALWVGALCMVAFLLKYPGAAVAIPIAGFCGFRALNLEQSLRPTQASLLALVREAAWFVIGAAVVLGLCVLPFALTGTMREMIEVCVKMTEVYAGSAGFPYDWYVPLLDPERQGPLFVTCAALFGLGLSISAIRRNWKELAFGAFCLTLAIASIVSVVLQKRLFNYHWIATYPFFVALAVWGLRQGAALVHPRASAPLLLAAGLTCTAAAFLSQPQFITLVPHTYREHVTRWWSVMQGEVAFDDYRRTYHRVAQADKFGDLILAADVVRERARPGDFVCLTCFISPIYQLSGLRCNTRHAIGTFTGLGPRSWTTEYNQHLRDDPPRFMVSIRSYPRRNKQLIQHGYREIARYGTVIVFERFGPKAR